MADVFNFKEAEVEWKEQHCKLFREYVDALEANQVRYVILKNAEGLPNENHSKDIDILIEPGKYKEASELLRIAYKNNGVSYYKIHKFERLRCWYGMNPEDRFAIHIDLLEGFLHKGFELFPFDLFYQHSFKNENGIYVLDEIYDCVILLLHSTICYHSIKEKYAKHIASIYETNKAEIIEILQKVLGRKASVWMERYLDAGEYKKIASEGKYFSHQSKKRILFKRPVFTLTNVLDFLWEKIARIIFNLKKYNFFFTVHAPDGTGKTTFIKTLSEELGFYYVCAAKDLVQINHFRPCMLPNLGAAGEKVGVMKEDKYFEYPHRAKPAGGLSSFVRMTYYWLDYVIGVPMILRKNAQFSKVTIFDRYIYDFLVDPRRTRICLPYWIRRLFAKMVKQPKLVFVLNTTADIIYQRKQELTKEEIERQLVEYRKLVNVTSKVVLLDASKTPEEIAKDAMRHIADTFMEKI